MKMKKIAVLGLVMLTSISILAACGSSKTDDSGKTGSEKKDTLTMATAADFPPYEYMEGNDYKGIDIELSQAIADKLGVKLEIQNVPFDSIIAGVQSGKYDFGMSGITINDERKQSVNFSDPYISAVQSIIVKSDSSIADKDALKDVSKIGVQTGTTGDTDATKDYGEDKITRYTVATDAIQALMSGKVDAVIIDNKPAQEYVKANGSALKILPTAYEEEQYAIAVNKSNDDLQKKINQAIKDLKADGTVDKILAKYESNK